MICVIQDCRGSTDHALCSRHAAMVPARVERLFHGAPLRQRAWFDAVQRARSWVATTVIQERALAQWWAWQWL